MYEKLRLYREATYLIPTLFVITFALLSPENVIDRVPTLGYIAYAFSEYMPFVRTYSELSRFPQVTQMTLTLAMGLVLVVWPPFAWILYRLQDLRALQAKRKLRRWGWLAAVLAVFPFYFSGPVMSTSLPAGGLNTLIGQSRIALGIFASTTMLLEVFFLT